MRNRNLQKTFLMSDYERRSEPVASITNIGVLIASVAHRLIFFAACGGID